MRVVKLIGVALGALICANCSGVDANVKAAQAPVTTTTTDASGVSTTVTVKPDPVQVAVNFKVADLQAAEKMALAQTPPDTTAARCYEALIPFVQQVSTKLTAPSQIAGGFSAFQAARNGSTLVKEGLAGTLIPPEINDACAPLVLDAAATLLMLEARAGLVAASFAVVP